MIPDQLRQQLRQIAERVKNGEKPLETVRVLLSWFGARRRGYLVVEQIRDALSSEGLATDPDIQYSYIDGTVEFISVEEASRRFEEAFGDFSPEASPSQDKDPTYRVRMLAAANHQPVTVTPDDTLEQAVTLMLANDYSQLPVMTNERDVKGIISWKSIAARLAFGQVCDKVRTCMEPHEEVGVETPILKAISQIVESECVLVRDETKKITGLITTADLSLQFKQLSEPFLLLQQIENRIRRLISRKFNASDFQAIRDPNDSTRKIDSIFDLTFGEYARLLEDPNRWSKLELKIDGPTFVRLLHEVREIRNEVMHFDPDPIPEEELEKLRSFSSFLERLDELCPQTPTKG